MSNDKSPWFSDDDEADLKKWLGLPPPDEIYVTGNGPIPPVDAASWEHEAEWARAMGLSAASPDPDYGPWTGAEAERVIRERAELLPKWWAEGKSI